MKDDSLRGLERSVLEGGTAMEKRALRHRLKESGGSAGLELSIPCTFEVVGTDKSRRYGTSLRLLRDGASEVHPFYHGVARPPTFAEIWEMRIKEYHENGGKAGPLLETWLDPCTGVYYEKNSSKFKLAPIAEELLALTPQFAGAFLPVNYQSICARELDSKNGIYNEWLTREQVLDHEAWNFLFEGKRSVLEEASMIAFDEVERRYQRNTAMAFWLVQNPAEDMLRPLCAYDPGDSYDADGDWDLYDGARFVRVGPQ